MPTLNELIMWGPQVFLPRWKKAGTFVPMGARGRPQYPSTDVPSLYKAYTHNEIVYAAINRKATAVIGPRLMVQGRTKDGQWEEIPGHPLRRLLMAPNPDMDEAAFHRAWIVAQDVTGVFYAEKVMGASKLPEQLYPLDSSKVFPVLNDTGVAYYEFKDGSYKERIEPERMLVKRMYDPTNKFGGLSPLAVCLGSIDADNAQTDFIREFFNNAGIPSGLLKIKGRKLNQQQADDIRAKWAARFGRQWGRLHDLSVLDEDADYQKVGANLDELASEAIRSFTESRISMTLDVPPLIIYAYVGLLRATYSNLKEAWRGFWDASLTPMFTDWASFLSSHLLTDFVDPQLILGEQIRLAWDFSAVKWLQDDVDAVHARARADFQAGAITLNEMRSRIGEDPDPAGDYYLRPFNVLAQPAGEAPADVQPKLLKVPNRGNRLPTFGELAKIRRYIAQQKAARSTIERRIARGMKGLLAGQYEAAARAIETRAA